MQNRRAFTLIELMIAIAIIGILTAVATISYGQVQVRSRDSQRMNDLQTLKLTLSTYQGAQLPARFPMLTTVVTINNSNDGLTALLKPAYIREMPLDPRNTAPYVYRYLGVANGSDYTLSATLENTNDKRGWAGGTSWVQYGHQVRP
jgi:prepilin-type N-terminal cleavage/methylation domain-containing protein